MTALVNRQTKAPVRFVVGLSLTIQASEDAYGNLEGRRLEALACLFAQNVRIYVLSDGRHRFRRMVEECCH